MSTSASVALPLSGVRVLELGQLIAGPFCGQILGDFGADVIKVERPRTGDPMRQWGAQRGAGGSPWWAVLSRNKRSVTCDLRSAEGLAIIKELIPRCDVVVENFRPGTLERLGLGWDVLTSLNEQLVLTRVSGYGQTGPYAERPGYGAIGEAMGGLRYVTGTPDQPPSRVGVSIGDSLAGLYAAIGTLVALRHRDRGGGGQVVDAALYEAVLGVMESLVTDFDAGGFIRERSGSVLPGIAPSNVYPTSDSQFVLIAANQDSVFQRLCAAMAAPELACDPRFASHGARGAHMSDLDARIAAWTRSRRSDEVLTALHTAGVPSGRMYTAADMVEDPHFVARESIIGVPHPEYGRLRMQNVVPKLTATPGAIAWSGPNLGAHNGEVLGGLLGRSDEELDLLGSAGIL